MTCLSAKFCKHAKDCDIHMCSNTIEKCRAFNRKPNNKEEWLKSLDTEQLAEEIVNMTLLDRYKLYDRMESAEYEHGIGIGAKKVIVEWLKQPHTDIDDWGVCKDCAIKDNCSNYKPCKRQCEDYEQEPQTNFEQITKDEATLTDWLQEKMYFCTEMPCDECIAYKECWHQGNDTDYSNADLWNGWLKQPHTNE